MSNLLNRMSLAAAGVIALAALTGCTPKTEVTLQSPQQAAGIAVTGTGFVSAKPDVARIDLGVSVAAPTVAKARGDAATAMQKVQDALKQKGVADKDVQTQSFTINPQYDNTDRTTPKISGYQVNNQVRVTVRNIDTASDVLDTAVAAGGNAVRVNGITFAVDQPDALLAQARQDAVKSARDRADVLAKAAGATLGKPRSISESSSSGGVQAPAPLRAGAADAVSTPVSPGEQRLSVTVSIVYDIAP